MKFYLLSIGLVFCLPLLAADKKPLTKEESAKVIDAAIRISLKKPTGELTKADFEKMRKLYFRNNKLIEVPKGLEKLTQLERLHLQDNQLTSMKGLENLTQLKSLYLYDNQLTNVKGLEKLTQLSGLFLSNNQLSDVTGLEKLTHSTDLTFFGGNPNLSKAQIAQLRKAFPKCEIIHFSTK